MIKVLYDSDAETVLFDTTEEKVLVSQATGSCDLPPISERCGHPFCIAFNAERPDTLFDDGYWDRGTIVMLNHGFASEIVLIPYFYFNGDGDPADGPWIAGFSVGGRFDLTIEVEMTPEDFFDNSHIITLQFYTDEDAQVSSIDVTAYGDSESDSTSTSNCLQNLTSLFVGSSFASNLESITLFSPSLGANPDTDEEDFIFPDDSFDSAVGSGQSTSGNAVIITGDASSGDVGYIKDLDPEYNSKCQWCSAYVGCPTPCCATWEDFNPCPHISGSFSFDWTIDSDDGCYRATVSSSGSFTGTVASPCNFGDNTSLVFDTFEGVYTAHCAVIGSTDPCPPDVTFGCGCDPGAEGDLCCTSETCDCEVTPDCPCTPYLEARIACFSYPDSPTPHGWYANFFIGILSCVTSGGFSNDDDYIGYAFVVGPGLPDGSYSVPFNVDFGSGSGSVDFTLTSP